MKSINVKVSSTITLALLIGIGNGVSFSSILDRKNEKKRKLLGSFKTEFDKLTKERLVLEIQKLVQVNKRYRRSNRIN